MFAFKTPLKKPREIAVQFAYRFILRKENIDGEPIDFEPYMEDPAEAPCSVQLNPAGSAFAAFDVVEHAYCRGIRKKPPKGHIPRKYLRKVYSHQSIAMKNARPPTRTSNKWLFQVA